MSPQWFHNGAVIPDANSDSLVITNAQASDAGDYSVALGAGMLNPPMDIYLKPVKLIGPVVLQTNQQFISTRPGSNVTFQVAFTGAPPVRLQWRHGQQPIPNATNATLSLTNVQLVDDGEYSVIASNSFGAVDGPPNALTILVRPTITVHPVSPSVVAGGSVTLSVSASGNPFPLSFRWRSNNVVVATFTLYDTNCFFTLTNVQPNLLTNQFRYAAFVTNLAGNSSLSSNAVITVLADRDGDGLPDEWESAYGFSVTNADDAILDSDGDGVTNAQEYLAGTDPRDPQNYLRLEKVRLHDANVWRAEFLAVSNRTYTLQASSGLLPSAAWHWVEDILAAPTNRMIEIVQPCGDPTNRQFFRVVTPRSP
jgi:hypothetical protein